MTAWVPVLAAITAAAAALLGYRLTNRSKQLEAKAKAYADALTAIEAYKSLPYRIRRRAKDGNDQAELQHLVGDTEQEVAFYRRWLALESPAVSVNDFAVVKLRRCVSRHSGTRRTRLVVRGRARASWRLGRIDQAETSCYLLGEAGLAAPNRRPVGGRWVPWLPWGVANPRARRVPANERIGDLRLPSCFSGKPCASRDSRRLAHGGHG
jgi:hypothetical protein